MDPVALSAYGSASTVEAPVSRMMSAFAADFREGVDINLGVGYVNDATIPHELIREALACVLERPQTYRAAFNYGGPAGAPYLIEALRSFLTRHSVGRLTDSVLRRRRLVIGASGATSLLEAIADVLPAGLVVTSDPNYYIFTHQLERRGFNVLAVPEDDDGIDTQLLRQRLDDLGPKRQQISFFYVVTVNNPTCSVLSSSRRRELMEIVEAISRGLGRKIPLVCDTAYEPLIHDGTEPPGSLLLNDRLGLVYEIGTLSKILAPALRIGYLIGEDSPLIDAVMQKVSDVGFSAPLANQAMAAYLLEHHMGQQIERVKRGYRKKAVAVRTWIDRYLGPFLSGCRGGRAGFYYYLTFEHVLTDESSPFFRYLSATTGDATIDGTGSARRPRVIYVPGEYCVQSDGEMVDTARRQMRISYGFEELPQIERGLKIMAEAVGYDKVVGGKHVRPHSAPIRGV